MEYRTYIFIVRIIARITERNFPSPGKETFHPDIIFIAAHFAIFAGS